MGGGIWQQSGLKALLCAMLASATLFTSCTKNEFVDTQKSELNKEVVFNMANKLKPLGDAAISGQKGGVVDTLLNFLDHETVVAFEITLNELIADPHTPVLDREYLKFAFSTESRSNYIPTFMKIRNEVRDIIRNDSLFIWLFDFEYVDDSVKCIVTFGKPGEKDTRKSAMGPWEPADKLWASPTIVGHTFSGYMGLQEWDNIFYHDSYNNGKIVINNHSGYPLTPGPQARVWNIETQLARNPNRNNYVEIVPDEHRVWKYTFPKPIGFHWRDVEYGGNQSYYFPSTLRGKKNSEYYYSGILEEYLDDIDDFYYNDNLENVFWYPTTTEMRNFMNGNDGQGEVLDYVTVRDKLFTKLDYRAINHYALATKIVAETWVLKVKNRDNSNNPFFAIDVDFQVNAADSETRTFKKNFYGTRTMSGYGTNYYNELLIQYCQMEGDAYEN